MTQSHRLRSSLQICDEQFSSAFLRKTCRRFRFKRLHACSAVFHNQLAARPRSLKGSGWAALFVSHRRTHPVATDSAGYEARSVEPVAVVPLQTTAAGNLTKRRPSVDAAIDYTSRRKGVAA